jgi:ABC-2 type transport system ATP-binding protein
MRRLPTIRRLTMGHADHREGEVDDSQAPALEFTGLCKAFGDHVAVDHIDLSVPRGSFFGLVGPNGAGKTTSLSMAVGLLRPDAGHACIFGRDVWSDPIGAKSSSGFCRTAWPFPTG